MYDEVRCMKSLWKYSGIFLIATGILHNLIGFILRWDIFLDIIDSGVWNTIFSHDDRSSFFWLISSGFFWIVLGHALHYYIKKHNSPVPKIIGWYLLGFAVIVVISMPTTGGWLFFPQAYIILRAKQ